MADGERRMLFDIRGRRRHVIKAVYAVLALLMGASLFLVVGPVNIGELVGGGTSTNSAAVFEDQAENLERRLRKDPRDEALLLALTRARINAGNTLLEVDSETGASTVTPEAHREFEAAEGAWKLYLKQAGEPSPTAAQLVSNTFFRLAESSQTYADAEANIVIAAEAQRIAAEERPSLGSLSTYAILQYFNGEFAGGDRSAGQAAAKAGTKAEAKRVRQQLSEYRKNAKKYVKQKKAAEKAEGKASKEQLTAPFQGLGGGATTITP